MKLRSFPWLAGLVLLCGAVFASAAEITVTASNFVFTPSNITIHSGDTVIFRNGGGMHNVVSNGLFRCANGCDSAGGNGNPADNAWTTAITFTGTGSLQYYCEMHGAPNSGMSGTITILGTPAPFSPGTGLSGNWYNPQQDGHGFQFEVLQAPSGVVTVFWFVFDNNRNQAWILGTGRFNDNRLVMDSGRRLGARFPPNFLSSEAVGTPWGTLTFTFSDCDHGHVDWTTTDPAFTPSGGMDIQRLTQVAGTSCPTSTLRAEIAH